MERAPLQVEVSAAKPGARILKLKGPLVLGNFFQFQAELRKEETQLTVIDLAEVPYMDSTGMGELVNYYVHCQRIGSRIAIIGTNDRIMDLFKITRVDTILPFVPTLEEALN